MKRAVMVLVIALCAMTLGPLTAQQSVGPAPAAGVNTAPVSAPSTALPGPRLPPEWRRFEPRVTDTSVSERASLMSGGGRHTLVVSTLVLVLIVVIVVLLVVK
jgi:hypothetical protein